MKREIDADLFHELWAGALFDIIHAVMTKCAGWNEDDQNDMVRRVIEQLAARYDEADDAL